MNDVLYEASTGPLVSMAGQNGKAVQVGKATARIFVRDAANWEGVVFDDEIFRLSGKVGFDPAFGAERRMLRAVCGVQTKFLGNVFV